MKTKKQIGSDFLDKINTEWYEYSAKSHNDCWAGRYAEYKSKKQVEFDLNVNHDSSLEIENAEETLGRKLSDDEQNILVKKFNRTVISFINLKKIRMSY